MKSQIIAIIIVLLIIGGAIFASWEISKYQKESQAEKTTQKSSNSTVKSSSSKVTTLPKSAPSKVSPPNYSNLIKNLPKNSMITDLPDGKSLSLKFFSFPKGERVWEKSFILSKGTMKEGNLDNPEVTLTLHSKYVNQINSTNLCDIMKKANQNKDLGFESNLGYASLAWKYSSLMKYKSCFS